MSGLRSPLRLLGALVVVYLGAPLVAFVVRLVSTSQRGFHQPGLWPALSLSLSSATISLALITVVGVPLAFVLARSTSRIAKAVGVLVQIPLALPTLMSGIILVYLVGPYTVLGRLFHRQLTNSRVGVVLAMTFVAAPFLIVAARSVFETIDQGLLDVAATLGHGEVSRFVRVAVPVAGPGIRAGMLLAWLRAFGEYGAVVVLAYNPTSLPVYTYNQFSGAGLPTTLAPTALALGVAGVVVALSRVRPRHRDPDLAVVDQPRAPLRAAGEPLRFDVDRRLGAFHLRLVHDTPVRHLAVLGPSGAGKSALLRSLAGLAGPGVGFWCGERNLGDVPVVERRVGYVAQGFALFPHLTVDQQLLFARGATPALAAYWRGRLGLDGLAAAYPRQLSGGQRQRVALAQALCSSPEVLLLDEPFSALDVPVRHELRRLLRQLQQETGLPTVLVTHDPEEAGLLSDDVLVVSRGTALQSGPSREVFAHPASPEVARLVGITNLAPAEVVAPDTIAWGGSLVRADASAFAPGTSVSWSVRPERVTLERASDEPHGDDRDVSRVLATVLDAAFVGVASDYLVAVGPSQELQVRSSDPAPWSVGEACVLVIRARDVSLWAHVGGGSVVPGAQ